jgi:hypothetical protein
MSLSILFQISRASSDHHIQTLCQKSGAKIALRHHRDGRVLLRLTSPTWNSPSFEEHAQLSLYAQEMLWGFILKESL